MQKKILTRVAILSLLTSLLSFPVFAQNRCDAEIEKVIDRYDLGNKTINKKFFTRNHSFGSREGGSSSYDVWISFKECSGNLVIRLGRSCQFETAYTKGECTIKGLKNY